MDKQKQIEEMARIMCNGCIENEAMTCRFTKEEMPCDFAKNFAETLYNAGCRKIPELPKDTVLTADDIAELLTIVAKDTRKETAEKFASLVEFHSVSTIDENGIEQFSISALGLKEILHEEFGIPYDKICKEITGVKG